MAVSVGKRLLQGGAVLSFFLLVGGGVYVIWRLGREEEVTPGESEAAGEGDPGLCNYGTGSEGWNSKNGLVYDSTHQVVEGGVSICASVTNNSGGDVTIDMWESFYCPDRGMSYCDQDALAACTANCRDIYGCYDNTYDYKDEPSGTLISNGQTVQRCRLIPETAACGIVQWDIFNPLGDMTIASTGQKYHGWLYYFGTMECPTPEPIDPDPYCTGMTSNPPASSGVVMLSSESDSLSVTATGADADGPITRIWICYALGGQDKEYYHTGGETAVFECEKTISAANTFTITHPYSYYVQQLVAKGKVPEGVDVESIDFHTNMFDNDSGSDVFCSSNRGHWPEGTCTGSLLQKNGCTDGYLCEDCNLGTNCCVLTAILEEEPPPSNPDWDISKRGTTSCENEGIPNVQCTVNYVITVENVGDSGSVGEVDYVEDRYDSSIQPSWIVSSPGRTLNAENGKVTWVLTGADRMFYAGVPKTFEYSVRLPSSMYGELLTNTALAHLVEGGSIQATENLMATCEGGSQPPVTVLPDTGLFDSAVGRALVGGGVLVLSGFVVYKSQIFEGVSDLMSHTKDRVVYWAGVEGRRERQERQRDRWERRMMRRIGKRGI